MTKACPRCKLDLPFGVMHRSADDCLVHLVPRYRLISHTSETQRKQISAHAGRITQLQEQVRIANGRIHAYVGPDHERRLTQFEQRLKFVMTELDRMKGEK